jgi:hypothetical protein
MRTGVKSQIQFRAQADDVYLSPFMKRPAMGVHAGFAFLDGIARGELEKHWDLSPFISANGPQIHASAGVNGTYPVESLLLPEQWSNAHVTELSGTGSYESPLAIGGPTNVVRVEAGFGYAAARDASVPSRAYGRLLASLENTAVLKRNERTLTIRVNAGIAPNAPLQRSIFASSADPWQTFGNDYFRPRGAALKQPDFTVIPLGGARMRGFTPLLGLDRVVSGNVDLLQRLFSWSGGFGALTLWGGPFADAGVGRASDQSPAQLAENFMVDGGVGISIRGQLYDREVNLRINAPLVVNRPISPASLGGLPSGIRWSIEW